MEKQAPSKAALVADEAASSDLCDVCDTTYEELPCATPAQVEALMVGLTNEEADQRRLVYGRNAIAHKTVKWYTILLKQFTSSMAVMIEVSMVLSAAVQEWIDFCIIAALLATNAAIGFYEEHDALLKVEGIKSALAPMTTVKRDGEFKKMVAADLVPGDIIYLRGGDAVPADVDWLGGGAMSIDTAALTGEPFPRKCPDSKGQRRAMAGCMVAAGNSYLVVQRTGIFTEMGSATLLMQQPAAAPVSNSRRSTKPQISVFERSIISVCERVMAVSVFVLLLVFAFEFWRGEELVFILTTCLSILIAAVPVALPVVMNVTLAIGASEMAKQEAIVTHLTAMQEIASMTMLCSDKTGTLTTAKINVFYDHIWTAPGFDRTQVLEWAAISSNPHAADDCIDVAILRSFRDAFPDDFDKRIKAYNVTKFVGFAPEVKRTVAYATHSEQGEVKAAKGLLDKVLSTGNDGGDSWECVNAEDVRHEVERVDLQMSTAGYKTLGVAVGSPDGSGGWVMKFAGVVPMLDPPRGDTKWVIEQIYACGISVKMVTGDHQNIAKETARLVGLGDGILHRDALALRDGDDRDSIIRNADGFAQVMPKDKNDVVRVLQSLNYVVGMTGDGVNDAPALKQAHIGIAVEGATDAARNAADIILTTEGLAPIFTAVLESRKIFQRVYSYVLYRISATVQIVSLLSLLIFVSEQTIKPLYVILLALLNDVTMITISYDNVVPSRSPEQPTIARLLRISCVFGALMTVASLIFYYAGPHIFLSPSFRGDRDAYTQSCIYLQISLGIEALIFITRVPEAPFYSSVPVSSLLFSVLGANLLVTALVVSGTLGPPLKWSDVGATWAYDALWFLLVDLVKVPLTLSLEKCFPPPPNAIGVRTAESTAGFAGQQPRSWSIGAFDIGYTALADASAAIGGNAAACCAHRGADAAPTRAVGVSAEAAVKVDAV